MKIIYRVQENLDNTKVIIRENLDETISFIPFDESNSDYQRYLRWLENPDAEEIGTIS